MADPAQPLLRHHAVSAVVQPDHVLAAAHRFEQRGQLAVVSPYSTPPCSSNQSTPVATETQADAGLAEDLALGLDVPARFHQRADDARQLGGGEFPPRVLVPACLNKSQV